MRKGERFNQKMVLEKTSRGYGSVNVWCGIIGHNKTPLIRLQGRVTSETYIWDVLREHVVPFFLLSKDFVAAADIPLFSWPAVSLDLNPIKNVWAASGMH